MYHTHENVLMILFTAEQINLHIFQYDMKYLVNQCTLRCSSIWSIRAWKKSKASCCSLMLTVWPQSLNTFQKRSGSWYWSLLSSKCPNTCWIWKNTLKNNKLSNINFGHIWIHRLKDLYMIRGFGFYHFQKSHYFLSPNSLVTPDLSSSGLSSSVPRTTSGIPGTMYSCWMTEFM